MHNSIDNFKPIGVFDSGYGGLTILKEFLIKLPQYDYVYLGDNARTPYGNRSFETVYNYTLQAVKKLFEMGCHLIILACNTASAKALRTIQQNDLPDIAPDKRVLGVVRPSVEALIKYTKSNHVGILGTVGTIISNSYPIEINKLYPEIQTFQEACPLWVPIVENGEHLSDGADYFVHKNISNLLSKSKNIDTIILGCTHYPLLINKIKSEIPDNVSLVTQGEIVAESLKDYLNRHFEIEINCSKNGQRQFFTTDSPEMFDIKGNMFLENLIIIKSEKIVLD